METVIKPARRVGAAMLLALCVSCGGGGGGSAEDAAPGGSSVVNTPAVSAATPAATDLLQMHVQMPNEVSYSQVEEGPFQDLNLQIGYSGDAFLLQGRTVYVFITPPPGVIYERPEITFDTTSKLAFIRAAAGKAPMAPGRYDGELKVVACFDPACRTYIGRTSIPFHLAVVQGIKVSPPLVSVHTYFGEFPPPVEATVTLPPGVTEWSFSKSPTEDLTKEGDKIVFKALSPYKVGQEELYASARVDIPDPNSSSSNLVTRADFKVVYEVHQNGLYYMSPRSVSHTLPRDPWLGRVSGNIVVARQRTGHVRLREIVFNPPLDTVGNFQWLRLKDGSLSFQEVIAEEYVVQSCLISGSCLPVGEYHATLRYQWEGFEGTNVLKTENLELPVTLRVTP